MDPAGLLLSTALLADAPSDDPVPATDTAFRLEAAIDLWFPRLEGQFTDAGTEVDVRATDLHDSEQAPAGALTLIRDRVRIELRGFSFATEGRMPAEEDFTLGGVGFEVGDTIDSGFSWWSAGAEVSFDIVERHRKAANATDFSLFVLGALDVQSVTRDLADIGTGEVARAREGFLVALVGGGVRLRFDTRPSFPIFRAAEIAAKGAVGISMPFGDGEFGGATRIEAMVTGWFDDRTAIYLGYRLVGASLTGDELEMTTSLQGLRVGFRHEF